MFLTGFILTILVGLPLLVVVLVIKNIIKEYKGSLEEFEETNENHREG